jgi:hypothetical protein
MILLGIIIYYTMMKGFHLPVDSDEEDQYPSSSMNFRGMSYAENDDDEVPVSKNRRSMMPQKINIAPKPKMGGLNIKLGQPKPKEIVTQDPVKHQNNDLFKDYVTLAMEQQREQSRMFKEYVTLAMEQQNQQFKLFSDLLQRISQSMSMKEPIVPKTSAETFDECVDIIDAKLASVEGLQITTKDQLFSNLREVLDTL